MISKKRKVLACLLMCLLGFSSSMVAFSATHYILLGKGYYQSSLSINSRGISSEYSSYWDNVMKA